MSNHEVHSELEGHSSESPVLLELQGITKRFPGVQALKGVDLRIRAGEVHALVGENGAGKSTLVNVIGGVVVPDEGDISLDGDTVSLENPAKSQKLGIAVVHQELSLFPHLDVASNILVNDLSPAGFGWISDKMLQAKARGLLEQVGLEKVPPGKLAGRLQPGEQQLIEIARALAMNTRIIVLDEPTSSLPEEEVRTLFDNLKRLKREGIGILFVSHHLDEIFEISDRVTVLRDGRWIDTVRTESIDHRQLVQMILGRDLKEQYQERKTGQQERDLLLSVSHLSAGDRVKDVSFDLHKREIVGIAGLLGSGRTETARAIFGLDKRKTGEIRVDGETVDIDSPSKAIDLGIGFITEDKRREGLMLDKSIKDNIVMAIFRKFTNRIGWALPKKERSAAEAQKRDLKIVAPSVGKRTKFLSGGNQQKVVLGKWLETEPQIYLLDEPTRGIDVGTKSEFYSLISDLASQGAGVVLITEEIMEMVTLCDRVLIMRDGQITGELSGERLTSENILLAITGGNIDE